MYGLKIDEDLYTNRLSNSEFDRILKGDNTGVYGNRFIKSEDLNFINSLRELNFSMMFRHPNILRFKEVYLSKNKVYMISEKYIPILKSKLQPDKIATDLIRALSLMIQCDVYHYDLKLNNVMSSNTETILIDLEGCIRHSKGRIKGINTFSTIDFSPPTLYSTLDEYVSGEFHIVYSLGVLMAGVVLGRTIYMSGEEEIGIYGSKLLLPRKDQFLSTQLRYLSEAKERSVGLSGYLIGNSYNSLVEYISTGNIESFFKLPSFEEIIQKFGISQVEHVICQHNYIREIPLNIQLEINGMYESDWYKEVLRKNYRAGMKPLYSLDSYAREKNVFALKGLFTPYTPGMTSADNEKIV